MQKQKGIALLLVIFLGWMGGHRYYLGQTSTAVLFTLFFWTGIPFLISIIDFFIILATSQQRLNERFTSNVSKIHVRSSGTDELEKLASLKERGHITEEEFNRKKAELLK